jgi:hypothetical protein
MIANKYHKEIGFKDSDIILAKNLINLMNSQKIKYSYHAIEKAKKESNFVEIGQFLNSYCLNFNDVFEIVTENNSIKKLGFRVNLKENDLVFILSAEKIVITLWINQREDIHVTLKKELYCLVSN